mgnify:CR=1 FL=1
MKSIKRLAALLLAMLMLALTGCAAARTAKPYSVYLISKSTTTEFWKSVFAGANAAKSEYNVDLTIFGPETEEDYEEQNAYIRQAIEAGRTRSSSQPSAIPAMRRPSTRPWRRGSAW